jgi:hypothetical protein
MAKRPINKSIPRGQKAKEQTRERDPKGRTDHFTSAGDAASTGNGSESQERPLTGLGGYDVRALWNMN